PAGMRWRATPIICAKPPRAVVAAGIASAAVAFITFLPALQNQFVLDDAPIIVNNPSVISPGPWYRLWQESWWPRGTAPDRLFRPLTVWTFRLNVAAFSRSEPSPFWFHEINLVLHGLTACGVALLAYRI